MIAFRDPNTPALKRAGFIRIFLVVSSAFPETINLGNTYSSANGAVIAVINNENPAIRAAPRSEILFVLLLYF
jgi:hypothetical protein